MKKIITVFSVVALLSACSGAGSSGSDLAKEVCDCYQKANGMNASDPNRAKAQADCMASQGIAWNKIKDNQKEADEFNKIIGDCGKELIKKSVQ
ncbi:MAG TPA: lipoprotein [Chitinophagaceae bacterium]|mgnify:FL=1|nr:lipoprotein [Chitinophagaceae bacterium]HRF17394.1 lipoprotein [Chitinophagaceae bacterium]